MVLDELDFANQSTTARRYKLNVYQVTQDSMPGAAGQMGTDGNAGLAYLHVLGNYLTEPNVIVHEYGHSIHYSEENWVDQGRYGINHPSFLVSTH